MSKFVVSARKYRPQTFDQIIGQNHIAQTLKNALQSDQLAHAFLFNGPRGVGKTTCARVLAKVLNCSNRQNNTDPCNECSSCTSFNDQASFNIIELDAASNNSVESIRNLIEQVRFQPQQGSYKVFIIDEVHMLSNQAFNAFLKTLEEPPSYAIFILATTEKHKVIPTILSRCQVFDFKRIQIHNIIDQLQSIVSQEGLTAETEALQIIAQKADGSMRDALSIYDKIASTSNGTITYKQTIENLNVLDFDFFFKTIDGAIREDLNQVFLTFDDVIKKGFDPELFVQGLGQHTRDILVAQHPKTLELLEVGNELKSRYLAQAEICSKEFLLNTLNILNKCEIELVRTFNKRLSVEIALSKMTYLGRVKKQERETSSSAEKKNTDLKSPVKNTIPPQIEVPVSKEVDTIKPEEKIEETTVVVSEEKEITVSHSAKAEKPTEDKNQSITKSPISGIGNIDAIRQKIKEESAAKSAQSKPLTKEFLQKCWDEYILTIESNSTISALKLAQIEVTDGIKVYVPTSVTKDIIQQELNLIQTIRDTFNQPDLALNVVVDLEKFPDQEQFRPKKMLTNREKYEKMLQKNPLLSKMTEKFDLKVDNH